MPAFDYLVLDQKGKERKGTIEGDSARHVRQQLREQSLVPLDVKPTVPSVIKEAGKSSGIRRSNQRIGALDLALITRQLATLVQSGMPIAASLQAVAQQTEKRKVRGILLSIRAKVTEGFTLAASLENFPQAFPEIYRATVAAGEHSGHLDLVLEQLADYTESSYETSKQLKGALIYPAIIVCFSVGIIIVMLQVVIPKMVTVFEHSGQSLPWLTSALIALSEWLQQYGIFLVVGMVILGVVWQQMLRYSWIKQRLHRSILTIPGYAKFIKSINAARVANTLCILSRSGVQLVDGLEISAQVTTNLCIREAVKQAAVKVREGMALNKALSLSGYFPPMLIHMVASGESSGELDRMLERAAANQQREIKNLITTLISLFEPLMMVVMGIIVLTIVLAVMLPVISMNQLVG